MGNLVKYLKIICVLNKCIENKQFFKFMVSPQHFPPKTMTDMSSTVARDFQAAKSHAFVNIFFTLKIYCISQYLQYLIKKQVTWNASLFSFKNAPIHFCRIHFNIKKFYFWIKIEEMDIFFFVKQVRRLELFPAQFYISKYDEIIFFFLDDLEKNRL